MTYKYQWTLRSEILDAVNLTTDDRFGDGSDRGIRKANLIVVATHIQPEDENRNYANARLTDIYTLLGKWLDVPHKGNAGQDWTMNRDLLEAIHEELRS